MTVSGFQYLALFFVSLLVCGSLTPLMKKLAIKFAIVDRPNQDHKTHVQPIPYLGGLAITGAVWTVVWLGSFAINLDNRTFKIVLTILLPATIMGLVGLWDDIKNLRPLPRFLAQTVGGAFTAGFIVSTNTVGSPTGNDVFDFIISVAWIVGITNAINFFDNLDGGAAGTVAISSLGLTLLSATSNQFYLASLSAVLSGAAFGFLFWNRNPARIYMGDAGALFLGMLTSSLLVRFEPNPINPYASFAIPILILAVPILDTSVAVISRIARRKSPFEGGQDHLSHRLLRRGLGRKQVAVILWLITILFVSYAFILSSIPFTHEGQVLLVSIMTWIALFFWFFRQDHEVEIKNSK